MDAWKEAMKPTITAPASAGVSEAEIALINRVKAKAKEVGALVVEIEKVSMGHPVPASVEIGLDHRWLAIGRTDLQKGFMAVIRAIARPEGF